MPQALRCADRILTFERPRIMGVLNITPDSFSDGGELFVNGAPDVDAIQARASDMIAQGADLLDIGGESTRPGAREVSVQEEIDRVVPAIAALGSLDTILSIDTRHAAVARAAVEAGAHLINDISAGTDPAMLDVVGGCDAGFALMHMEGTPQTMQQAPVYDDVVDEVRGFLAQRFEACVARGISPERLMTDPGIGFGKTVQHNLKLLQNLEQLRKDDRPLLVGVSRKSMLGKITGRQVGDRIVASVTSAVLAAQRGADILRVHDVSATRDGLRVLAAMEQQGKHNT